MINFTLDVRPYVLENSREWKNICKKNKHDKTMSEPLCYTLTPKAL